MIYAGIGSRETPPLALEYMERMAREWAQRGDTLRSGGARGADLAFETGAVLGKGRIELFLRDRYSIGVDPNATGPYSPELWRKAMKIAEKYHPNWSACSSFARQLHARNSFIILGERLNDPVHLVVCWTEGGKLKGGTAQGLRIAYDYKIPVANLGDSRYGY